MQYTIVDDKDRQGYYLFRADFDMTTTDTNSSKVESLFVRDRYSLILLLVTAALDEQRYFINQCQHFGSGGMILFGSMKTSRFITVYIQ